MGKCIYCGASAGLLGRVCGDCKKLLARVAELRGKVSSTELMKVMGISGRQTANEVKRIRELVDKDSE
jgi:hypothetical protein